MKKIFLLFTILLQMQLSSIAFPQQGISSSNEVRLYALDCGEIDVTNLAVFSDTNDYDGQPGKLVEPCFLIHHPKGWLIWETGLGDKYIQHPQDFNGFKFHAKLSLESQLSQLGLTPNDITYVAFSHLHHDITGNANLFLNSTWLFQKSELEWALSIPTPSSVEPNTFDQWKLAKTKILNGDYDVFDDNTVKLLRTPGHTPGHMVLELNLQQSGVIIISGDLYILRSSFEPIIIPSVNVSRADTMASSNRIKTILKKTHGRIIIEHNPQDIEELPKFPNFLR